MVRAVSTAARDIGSDRKRSIRPVSISLTIATAVPGAVCASVMPSIPLIR